MIFSIEKIAACFGTYSSTVAAGKICWLSGEACMAVVYFGSAESRDNVLTGKKWVERANLSSHLQL